MSHRGEALMKHDRKVCDFCPIITPLDYTINQPVSLCNLSDMCATVQLFKESCSDAIIFPNISLQNTEKHLYMNFYTDVLYIKLFICNFIFKNHLELINVFSEILS